MKILVTGTTKSHTMKYFYLKQQLKVIPSTVSLCDCLEDMGHIVDMRPVTLDEDFNDYDRVILFLQGPSQMTAMYFYHMLYVVSKVSKDKLILAFDDWQIKGVFSGIISTTEESLFRDFTLRNAAKDIADIDRDKYRPIFMDGIEKLKNKDYKILLSAFAGGDLDLLIDDYDKELIYQYNPNPYHHNRRPGNRGDIPRSAMNEIESLAMQPFEVDNTKPENKERRFNFASLVQSQTKKWLKNRGIDESLIDFYGSRKDKQDRLKEGDMVKVFNKQWFCLMPGYYNSGSGWWRARPLQVADGGSILIGDKKELMVFYKDATISSLTGDFLLGCTTAQLIKVAKMQKDALYENHPLTKSVQKNELERVLQ